MICCARESAKSPSGPRARAMQPVEVAQHRTCEDRCGDGDGDERRRLRLCSAAPCGYTIIIGRRCHRLLRDGKDARCGEDRD